MLSAIGEFSPPAARIAAGTGAPIIDSSPSPEAAMNRICLALFALSTVACAPKPAETATDTATHQMAVVPDRAEVQRGTASAGVHNFER